MKATTFSTGSALVLPLVLGIIIATITYATLTGKHLPLVNSPRAALVAILIVGLAMCSGGIGQVGASGKWVSPLAIIGYLLGAAILVVIGGTLLRWKLPLIASETNAVLVSAVLIGVKYMIGTLGYFFHLL
ncbi:MAG TPA: hypothetical protein VMT46_12435 [Anaerolineaceae bacterium]|nr:hypothetical protein [Anaerolineaceae bacterium]